MGTSSSFGGASGGTPLLPTWAEPPATPTAAEDEDLTPDEMPSDDNQPSSVPHRPQILLPPQNQRFRAARTNFTRFVSSGGDDRRALGRALGDHVRTVSGGARNAALRMGASRVAATNFLDVLHSIRDKGADETLRNLSLDHLSGRPAKEVLLELTDIICEPGGPIDEAIARDAFIDAVLEQDIAEDLDSLTDEQIEVVFLDFIGRSITTRVIEDIGQKLDTLAFSPEQANYLTVLLKDFVLGAVRDGLSEDLRNTRTLEKQALGAQMQKIYEIAFSLIETEANSLI